MTRRSVRACVAALFVGVTSLTSAASAHRHEAADLGDPGAETPPHARKDEDVDVWLDARYRFVALTDFPLDPSGAKSGQSTWSESYLRGGLDARYDVARLRFSFDALSGIDGGDRTPLGTLADPNTLRYPQDRRLGLGALRLRELFAEFALPFGTVAVGQRTIGWGLGILYDDGEARPDFGDRRFGTIVERVSFTTRPFARVLDVSAFTSALTLFVAADAVLRDTSIDWIQGDRAYGGVVGAHANLRDLRLGVLESFRKVTDRQGGVARTATTDGWLSAVLARPDDDVAVRLELESAFTTGSSERARAFEGSDGDRLRSLLAAARLRLDLTDEETTEHFPVGVTVKTEVGGATFFGDPGGGTARAPTMNEDHKVGMILFDQVLTRVSARQADLAAGAEGARLFSTNGGVSNAYYVNPVARAALKFVELRLGWLGAWRARNVDGATGRFLGHELDLGVHGRLPLPLDALAHFGLEGGLFHGGGALPFVGSVWTARLFVDLVW